MTSNHVFLMPKPTPDIRDVKKHQQIHMDQVNPVYSAPAKFCGTPQQKSVKRLRKIEQQRTRCNRRLDFASLGLPVQTQNPVAAARRNERERNRVKHINDTFTVLRDHLPSDYNTPAQKVNKEMSKVEILRAAIDYITTLEDMLTGKLHISPDVDLKALIEASTSPDGKSPEISKDIIGKLLESQRHNVPSADASPTYGGDIEQSGRTLLNDQLCLEHLGKTSSTLTRTHSQGIVSSDLNANEVKQFPGFMDHVNNQYPVQHNQVSQSHQFETIKVEDNILTSLPSCTEQTLYTDPIAAFDTVPVTQKAGYSVAQSSLETSGAAMPRSGCDSHLSLFDSMDIAEVDFTSLLMGCD